MRLQSDIAVQKQALQSSTIERCMMFAGSLLGITGIALQFHYMMQIPGVSTIEAAVRFFSFFTILTNLLLVAGYVFPLLTPELAASGYFSGASVRGALAVYIVVVGAVYNLLLRQLYHPVGWAKVADILVHDVAPVLYVVFWFVFAAKAGLRWADAGKWLLYPLAYLAYTLARGALVHYYPYPFIDVAMLGYVRVLVNAAGFTVVFWGLGLIVVATGRALSSIAEPAEQLDAA